MMPASNPPALSAETKNQNKKKTKKTKKQKI
jgi:hypothetical protein